MRRMKFHPENADSGGKFVERSMIVIGRPSIAAAALLFMSFFSSQCGTPLLDNLVSFPLILKDVQLCIKVKSRMFHFFFRTSKHPRKCVFVCYSVYKAQRVDGMNSRGRV